MRTKKQIDEMVNSAVGELKGFVSDEIIDTLSKILFNQHKMGYNEAIMDMSDYMKKIIKSKT